MKNLFSSPQSGTHIVAVLVVTIFGGLLVTMAVHIVQTSPTFDMMLGYIGAAFQTVVGYYLGDSMSSARKSAQISHLIGAPAAPDSAKPPAEA